mgnify:CR=1 FL=1
MLTKEHPKGLNLCFSVAMWERAAYHGVRVLLMLFMTKALMFSAHKAGNIFGYYTSLVFLTPLLGGYVADKFWGQNKSIIFGSFVLLFGHILLSCVGFMDPSLIANKFEWLFYLSLLIMTLGGGFFRSNLYTVVGSMYDKKDTRRDSAYTIFYMGINLGGFLAPLLCGTLGERIGWGWGFLSSSFLILIGIIHYLTFNKKLLPSSVFHSTTKHRDGTKIVHLSLTKEEKQKIRVIFIMAFFTMFFWAAAIQGGSSLTLFADRSTIRYLSLLKWQIPTSWFQLLNPVCVICLAPVFASMWIRLAKKNIEPSTVSKFIIGLVLMALGFFVMVFASIYEKDGPVSMLWLIGSYFIQTIGELCLSPVGFSVATKLSPARFASLLMGVWFASNFMAGLVSGWFAGLYDIVDHRTFFMLPVITSLSAAMLLFLLSKPIKRWMHDIH